MSAMPCAAFRCSPQYDPGRWIGDPHSGPARPRSGDRDAAKSQRKPRAQGGPGPRGVVDELLLISRRFAQSQSVPLSLVTRLEEIDATTIEVRMMPGRPIPRSAHAARPRIRQREDQEQRARSPCSCSRTMASAAWVSPSMRSSTLSEERLEVELVSERRELSRIGDDQGASSRARGREAFPAARLSGFAQSQGASL